MHDIAKYALNNNISLKDAALNNKIVNQNITENTLKDILDPETYIGLAADQAQIIVKEIELKRSK